MKSATSFAGTLLAMTLFSAWAFANPQQVQISTQAIPGSKIVAQAEPPTTIDPMAPPSAPEKKRSHAKKKKHGKKKKHK
jgi:hypothetical protein